MNLQMTHEERDLLSREQLLKGLIDKLQTSR
jgi:hypothetical protein